MNDAADSSLVVKIPRGLVNASEQLLKSARIVSCIFNSDAIVSLLWALVMIAEVLRWNYKELKPVTLAFTQDLATELVSRFGGLSCTDIEKSVRDVQGRPDECEPCFRRFILVAEKLRAESIGLLYTAPLCQRYLQYRLGVLSDVLWQVHCEVARSLSPPPPPYSLVGIDFGYIHVHSRSTDNLQPSQRIQKRKRTRKAKHYADVNDHEPQRTLQMKQNHDCTCLSCFAITIHSNTQDTSGNLGGGCLVDTIEYDKLCLPDLKGAVHNGPDGSRRHRTDQAGFDVRLIAERQQEDLIIYTRQKRTRRKRKRRMGKTVQDSGTQAP
jgi:hypothetical protein